MAQQNPGDLVKQVARMRKDMEKVHEDLKERYVEASVGGELVEVMLNGQQEVVKISIDPKILQPGSDGSVDVEMVEDLLIAALNQGLEKSKNLMSEEMNRVSGGMAGGFPGLF